MTHTPTPAHQPGMTGGSMSMSCPKCGSETPIGHRCIVDDLEAIRNMEPSPEVLRLLGGPPTPEAADPTPGEVGLPDLVSRIREMATVEFDRKGYHDPRGAAIWDVAAFIAEEYAPALAARTADLRAEHAAEVERLRSQQPFRVAEANRLRAEAAEAEVAELRATVERVEALADEWEADYPTSLASCRREVDEWWIDLRAALTAHRHEEAR